MNKKAAAYAHKCVDKLRPLKVKIYGLYGGETYEEYVKRNLIHQVNKFFDHYHAYLDKRT